MPHGVGCFQHSPKLGRGHRWESEPEQTRNPPPLHLKRTDERRHRWNPSGPTTSEASRHIAKDDDGYFWVVKATSMVSEVPETWDYGTNLKQSAAERDATRSLKRAGKNAPDRNPNSGEPNPWMKEEKA